MYSKLLRKRDFQTTSRKANLCVTDWPALMGRAYRSSSRVHKFPGIMLYYTASSECHPRPK